MTDAEIIATFMEPKPGRIPKKGKPDYGCGISKDTWWIYALPGQWEPRDFALDALWVVEERLRLGSPLERRMYHDYGRNLISAQKWHADAPTRIKALAAVLRPDVEAK